MNAVQDEDIFNVGAHGRYRGQLECFAVNSYILIMVAKYTSRTLPLLLMKWHPALQPENSSTISLPKQDVLFLPFQKSERRGEACESHANGMTLTHPTFLLNRMQRKAAYNQTKKDVSKWQETVMLNRCAATAPHWPTYKTLFSSWGCRRSETVRFPLTDDKEATGVAKITEVHKPQTDMEQEVAAILR